MDDQGVDPIVCAGRNVRLVKAPGVVPAQAGFALDQGDVRRWLPSAERERDEPALQATAREDIVEAVHWRSIGGVSKMHDTRPRMTRKLAATFALLAFVSPAAALAENPFAPAGLGTGPGQELRALMEVTFLKIDVLTLTVRISPSTAARLRAFTEGRHYSEALADSVAAVILASEDLWARQVLHRDVSYGRMLGGMREVAEKAARAGYVTTAYFERFSANLPELFGFLKKNGAREGDAIYFRSRGDTLRTLYRAVDGSVLLDRSTVDPEARRCGIPSFFAPGTRLRTRLVESLLEPGRP